MSDSESEKSQESEKRKYKPLDEVFSELLTKRLKTGPEVVLSHTNIQLQLEQHIKEQKQKRAKQIINAKQPDTCRLKSDSNILDLEAELKRIATVGVVKLFNAVTKAQKVKDKPLESLAKSTFLDVVGPKKEKQWSVFDDDFFGSRLNDWDIIE